jgi:hypothetical protein
LRLALLPVKGPFALRATGAQERARLDGLHRPRVWPVDAGGLAAPSVAASRRWTALLATVIASACGSPPRSPRP